jgi:penicillin-insensitive murein endopeptidase
MHYLAIFCVFIVGASMPVQSHADTSTCFGTTSKGRLENGVQLPVKGNNFEGYSTLARLAGRTYVHSAVKKIIVNAYHHLETDQPDKVFKYAETGLQQGGRFSPHKTHQNGLSVDFMTPINDKKGTSVHFPTNPLTKWGYNIEFDHNDQYNGLTIDYDALAAHVVALHKEAKKLGYDLWRVIFDPTLQSKLLTTQYAEYLKQNIQFSKKRSWVRHDEHYHVDFKIPCN